MGRLGADYFRHSAAIRRTKAWQVVRLEAKRRDGFKCVQCGSRHRLEVDHIKPVRTHPELALTLSNLQVLCARHHSQKTIVEIGLRKPPDPKRQAWRELVAAMAKP